MKLLICPLDDATHKTYENHSTYHIGDSGVDLFCPETITIRKGETQLIDMKICCEAKIGVGDLEKNVSYLLCARSSISKTNVRMSNGIGIMDAGYRGPVCLSLDNIKDEDYTIEKGQRIAQICAPNLEPIHIQVVDSLSDTTRGAGGFGSTGK